MRKFLTITDNLWMLWCLSVAFTMVQVGVILTFILTLGSKHGVLAIEQYIQEGGGEG